MKRAAQILFLLAGVLGLAVSAAEYRLDPNGGAPVIRRDGKAVAPRMLWVQSHDFTALRLKNEWTPFELDFTSEADAAKAGVLFYFENYDHGEGMLELADVQLIDRETADVIRAYDFSREKVDPHCRWWSFNNRKAPIVWRTAKVEGQSVLRLGFAKETAARLRHFNLCFDGFSVQKGRVFLLKGKARVVGRKNPRPWALIGQLWRLPDGKHKDGALISVPRSAVRQIRLAHEAGVDFVSTEIRSQAIWPRPGVEPDYYELDHACRMILSANPKARIIPRINTKVPGWWVKAHPGEMQKYENGSTDPSAPSIASPVWRREAAELVRRVVQYCETHFKENMAGYHVAGGNTGEWFYIRSINTLSGYDAPTLAAYRAWLKKKYGSDAALARAWKKKSSFAAVTVPTPAERRGAKDQAFFDPARQDLADFAEFWQENIASAALELAHVVRKECGKKRLVLLFYGYHTHFGWSASTPAGMGHYALRRMLDSPDVDCLCGPIGYYGRGLDRVSNTMTVTESVAKAGKLWINEDDTCTHLAYEGGSIALGVADRAKNLEEGVKLVRRNLVHAELRNLGIWLMDLTGVGAFDDPAFWEEVKKVEAWSKFRREHPSVFRPDVVSVLDDKSMHFVTHSGSIAATKNLLYEGRVSRREIGASFGQFLLDDVLAGRASAKCYFMTGVFALTRKERQALRKLSEKTPAFWTWAPGYLDLEKGCFSLAAVRETTGFEVNLQHGISFNVTSTGTGLRAGLPYKIRCQRPNQSVAPVLSPVVKPGDAVLAKYDNGAPAVVFRPGKIASLFCGTPQVPRELYVYFVKMAKVPQLSTLPGSAVVANDGVLSVYLPQNGKGVIRRGAKLEKKEFYSGRIFGPYPLPVRRGDQYLWLPDSRRKKMKYGKR